MHKRSETIIGEDFEAFKRSEIQAGLTTQDEVEDLLGAPYRKYTEDGRNYYEYYYERNKKDSERLLFILETRESDDRAFKQLVIQFENKVVIRTPKYSHNFVNDR